MARNAEIKGSVAYDVTFDADDGIAKLEAAVEGVTAKIDVAFGKAQVRGALKEATAGYQHKIDVVFSKTQVRKALKVASAGATVKADVSFSKKQLRTALKAATAGAEIRIDVDANDLSTKVATIVTRSEKKVTEIHAREAERRKSLDKRLETEREIAKKRADERIRILDKQRSDAIIRIDRQEAATRERINASLNARLEAQNNQARLREAYAINRERARIERQASKPIIQRILVQTDKINSSLTEFDRSMTRALRTSLTAFTVWSAGVSAAFGVAAVAGVAAFAQLEDAAVRAGATIASQQRIDEIEKYGKAISDFSSVTQAARLDIEKVAQRVALESIFDPTEVATAIGSLIKSGQSAEQAFINVGSAAAFASVNNADLIETADGLATALAGAGLSADDSSLLLDKISLTAADAVGDVEDYFAAFANGAGAAGRIIGATTDETLFFLKLLGQSGQLGLPAGTQVDIIFRDLGRAVVKAGDEWKKYGLKANAPLGEQVVLLAELVEKTGKNKEAQARLRKDLGFQEKSFRGLSRIIPQVLALGTTTEERLAGVNREIAKTASGAEGLVELQLNEIQKDIKFQFDQLLDSFRIGFQEFGRGAGDAAADLIDVFAGTGGLLDQAQPQIRDFGDAFGEVLERVADFVQTDNFRNGMATLVEAMQVTIGGLADAFDEFSAAFGEGEKAASTFESIADTILGFSKLSARVLPVVADIIGEIFDLLIDNADAFETFAKLALAVFALRKAYGLIVKPIAVVTSLLLAQTTQYGAMATNATLATRAISALTGAQIAQATASTKTTAAGAVNALGQVPGFGGHGIFRNRNRAEAIGDRGREGVEALKSGAGHADGALAARNAAAFEKVADSMKIADKSAAGLARSMGKLTLITAVIVTSIDLAIGAFDGFTERLGEIEANLDPRTLENFRSGLDGLQWSFNLIVDALQYVSDATRQVGSDFGRFVADDIYYVVAGIGLAMRGIESIVDHTMDLINMIVQTTGDAVAATLNGLADTLQRLGAVMGPAGAKVRKWAAELRGAAGDADAWGTKVERVKKKTEELAQVKIHKYLRDTRRDVWVLNEEWVRNRDLLKTAGSNAASAAKRIADGVLSHIPGATAALNELNEALRQGAANTAAADAFTSTFERATEGRDVAGLTAESQADALIAAGNAAGVARLQALNLFPALDKVSKSAKKTAKGVGGGSKGGSGSGGGSTADPESLAGATQAAADSTRNLTTAADQASAAVDKMSGKALQSKALATIGKATRAAGDGYKATRVEAEVLRRVLPGVDRELENQRASVQKLDQALQALQSTQLKGTRAFSDQLFANEQQVKALQLQRVDLVIAGTSEEDATVKAIDDQIRALQLQAERTSLAESLELDPLRRKLDETFNPLTELPFEEIMRRVTEISKQKQPLQDAIAGGENLRAVLDKTIGEAEARFETAGKDVSAGLARGVIAGSKNVQDAGRKNGQAALAGLNEIMEFGSPSRTTHQRGLWAAQGLANGMTAGTVAAQASASALGDNVMDSLLVGLKQGFGTPEAKDTPAWYLNVFIPKWIRQNKGPLAYDSTILVPAGNAIMEGFGRGLRDGFGQIQGFVKEVGPSLGEYISADAFGGRTAEIMADIAIGKTPDIEGVLGDLRGSVIGGSFGGILDPTLGFLHPTMSSADTLEMAQHLAKLFGTPMSDFLRAPGTMTTSGNISSHTYGRAVDFSNGSQPTPQMDALYGALQPMLGKVFHQLLYRTMVGGNHFNHVHADWLPAPGFSMNSGKKGNALGFDIPGVGGAIEAAIGAAAAKYKISAALLSAVIKQESGFRANVVSPDGGYGLMQLTSAGLVSKARSRGNIFDPMINVDVGAGYFKSLLDMFHGNVFKALMGYNGGPGAAMNPFAQVVRYASSVLAIFKNFGGAREHGGPVSSGKTYLVGERGPELWTPSRAGSIVDAATTRNIMAGNQTGAAGPVYQDYSQTHVTTAATDPDIVAAKIDRRRKRRMSGVNLR